MTDCKDTYSLRKFNTCSLNVEEKIVQKCVFSRYRFMNTPSQHTEINDFGRHLLRVNNMVCDRCILVVERLLHDLDIRFEQVELGQIKFYSEPDAKTRELLEAKLEELGFSLARDMRDQMVARIKAELVHYMALYNTRPDPPLMSDFLAERLHRAYPTLSRTFSDKEGMTIEKYLILMRMERVKDYLDSGEYTLTEIAYKLGYSSVQHLSAQFRKVTGLSVSGYQQLPEGDRKRLDAIGR